MHFFMCFLEYGWCVFLNTAENDYLQMIHFYSRISLGTYEDHFHQLVSGSGFLGRIFLSYFHKFNSLNLEKDTLTKNLFYKFWGLILIFAVNIENFVVIESEKSFTDRHTDTQGHNDQWWIFTARCIALTNNSQEVPKA